MRTIAVMRIGMILTILLPLTACQSKLFTAEGKPVAAEKRMALPAEGSESGSWQGKTDLTVNYTVTRAQDTVQISGDIVFKKRHKKLNTFQSSLVLVDANGAVLTVTGMATAGGRDVVERVSFNIEQPLPPTARFFAFSYTGETSGRGDNGSPKQFWSVPWSS